MSTKLSVTISSLSGTKCDRDKLQKEGINLIVVEYKIGTQSDWKCPKQGPSPWNLPIMRKYGSSQLVELLYSPSQEIYASSVWIAPSSIPNRWRKCISMNGNTSYLQASIDMILICTHKFIHTNGNVAFVWSSWHYCQWNLLSVFMLL